jgi:hypothetical protein
LKPAGCRHAGTDFLRPADADRARGRPRQLDPAARRFAVTPSAAIKLMQRVRSTGSAAPARYCGHRRPRLEPHEADLRRLVETIPDITLASSRPICSAASASSPRSLDDPPLDVLAFRAEADN